MKFETIKCQDSFFNKRLTFCCVVPTLPTAKVLVFVGI